MGQTATPNTAKGLSCPGIIPETRGGNDDQLYAGASKRQALHAGGGNETLFGGFASGHDTFYGGSGSDQIVGGGGSNTIVVGTGTATITAGASNRFEFIKGAAGGTELVDGLTNAYQVNIALRDYGSDEAKHAVATQTSTANGVTITLADNTHITFQNISHLTTGNFS